MRPLIALCCLGLAACGSPTTTLDAGRDAGSVDAGIDAGPSASLFGVFHREGTLEADGGFTPANGADNSEFLATGSYRQSQRGCSGGGGGMGLWEQRGDALFLPDDRPTNPGELVRAVSGSAAITITREGSATSTRWQPGGLCLLGCDAGVAVVEACATPQW